MTHLPPRLDLALLFASVLLTGVSILGFRRRSAWPVLVLFLVPIVVSLAGGDLLAAALAPLLPAAAGSLWFWFVCGAALWIPTELLQQSVVTKLVGGGRQDSPARESRP